ncbi:MAG: M67 family metallopeptidase [Pseudomonadota bacterium]
MARKEKRSFDKLRTNGVESVLLSRSVVEGLLSCARSAQPHEACGILLGKGNRITAFTPTANVHLTPETHFEIDPQALIDAHRAEREGGLQVLGYFHSHPNGTARPSETDARMATGDGRIWAVGGCATKDGLEEPKVTLWRDLGDGFEPLSYTVIEE